MQILEFSEDITVPSNFGPCGNRKLGCIGVSRFSCLSLSTDPSSFFHQNKTARSIDVTVAVRGESPLFLLPGLC